MKKITLFFALLGLSLGSSASDYKGVKKPAPDTIVCSMTASVVSHVNPTCFGNTNGSASITDTNGTSPFTYAWSNGSTLMNLSNVAAGSYTVTVTDANGCTATATATITNPASVNISVTPDSTGICPGGSVSMTASGGQSYTWSPSTGLSITNGATVISNPTSSITYTVSGTNANGCTGNNVVHVYMNLVPGTPTITSNSPVSLGSTLSLTASTAAGSTYSWTGPNGFTSSVQNPSISNVTAGNAGLYHVTATKGGCSSPADSAFVTVNSCTLSATISSSTNPTCISSTNGSLISTATGGTAPYTYLWSHDSITNATATGLSTGTYSVTVKDANGCSATVSKTLTAIDNLKDSITSKTNIGCSGGSTGSTTVTASSGTYPYTYSWTTAPTQTGQTASNLAAGSYTVTVHDSNNCSVSASVTLTTASSLNITVNQTSNICVGGSATLVASGATYYTWSPSSGLNKITGASVIANPGATSVYTVTGTDSGSACNGAASAVVIVNTAPATPTITTNSPVSSGGTLYLTVDTVSEVNYSWTGPNGFTSTAKAPFISNMISANAGIYFVTANSALGCGSSKDSTSVTLSSSCGTKAHIVSSTNPTCNGSSNGSASVSDSGGSAPYTYAWSNGAITSAITNVAGGTYTVTITDNNSCSASTTVSLTPPAALNVSVSPDSAFICSGSSTTLTATGATTLTWSPSTGLNTTNGATVIATPSATITYTVTGMDTIGGCSSSASVTVNITSSPILTISPASPTLCAGSSITLSASGYSTYSWNTGATASSISVSPTATTTYTVTGSSSGCGNATQTVTVSVTPAPVVTLIASSSSICAGNSVTLTASGAKSYTWGSGVIVDTSSTNIATASPSITTTYSVTGISTGCNNVTQTVTITVNPIPSTPKISSNSPVSFGGTLSLTTAYDSGATYSWTGPNSFSSTVQNPSIIGATSNATGNYTVTVKSAAGCMSSAGTAAVTVGACGMKAMISSSTNPTCSGNSNGKATVIDSGGTAPFKYLWTPTSDSATSATNLSAGTYSVTMTDANGCTATTTVILHSTTAIHDSITSKANPSCGASNGSIQAGVVGGTAPYTYLWSPSGQTIATAANLASGTYTLTVTDANGCSSTLNTTLNQPSIIKDSVTSLLNPTCNLGTNGSISVSPQGGTPPYTYSWNSSPVQTTLNASNLTAGTYSLTVTDANGCNNILGVTLTNPAPVTFTITPSASVICKGSSVNIAANGTTSYSWLPGSLSGSNVTVTPTLTTTYTVTGTDVNGCTATVNQTIKVSAQVIAMPVNNESCNGLTNGNVSANVSGGILPYSYTWSNGSTNKLIYNIPAATYSVTVTDSLGCTATASATVTEPGVLSVSANGTNASCGSTNGTATASPTGGFVPFNYTWSTTPAQTGITATNLAAGTYTVTLVDGTGCSTSNIVTISAASGPVINPTITPSTCGVSDGRITIATSGGTAPYRYSWNNGDTLSTDSNLASGTYILTVTDKNGCSNFQAMNINDAGAPVITVTNLTNVACNGDTSGAITINVTGGSGGYKYLWSNSATTSAISALSAGPYQITVTASNGCTAVQTLNITEPTVLSSTTNTVFATCGNSDGSAAITVAGGAVPYTYLWNNGATSAGISNIAVGTYSITVTDNNGCSITDLASVSNASGPQVTLDSVINYNCITKVEGSIVINVASGTPPYNYLWSNGVTTQNVDSLAAGNYGVTVTDATGCAGTASTKITTALPPGVSICMVTVDPATGFNNISFTPDAYSRIARYYIYKETTTPGIFNIIGHVPGNVGLYVDTLSDADNRGWSYEISELDSCGQASPISESILFETIHLTATATPSNGVSLVWNPFEGATFNNYIVYRDSIPGITYDSIATLSNTTLAYTDYPPADGSWYYHVGINGAATCVAPPTIGKGVDAVNYNSSKSNSGNITFSGPTGVKNIAAINTMEIYPNPNRGIFDLSLTLTSTQSVDVKIYTTLGQVITEQTFGKLGGTVVKQFDLSDLAKGVYFVKVSTDNGIMYRKVVIQ